MNNSQPNINQEPVKIQENAEQKPVDLNPNQSQEQPDQETAQQINWRKFKEARERDRIEAENMRKLAAEKEAQVEAYKQALEAVVNKPTQPNYQNDGMEIEESEEQRIERKIEERLAKAEQKRIQEYRQREAEELPKKVRELHSDFDQVCSQDNLLYLEYQYPEIAKNLQKLPDSLDKWNDVYKIIKKLVKNPDSNKEAAKAEKNFNKPQSISGTGMTQTINTTPSYQLTDDRKAANWARMQAALRGISE